MPITELVRRNHEPRERLTRAKTLVGLVGCCVLFAMQSIVRTQTLVRLNPDRDAHVEEANPTSNYGSISPLKLTKEGNAAWIRTYFGFDVTKLASLGAPDSAVLRLYQSGASGAGCLAASAHNVTNTWSEGAITWQSQPAFDSNAVDYRCVGDSFYKGWRVFDVTSIARTWWSGANHGLMLRTGWEIRSGASRLALIRSREDAVVTERPLLELRWGITSFGTACASSENLSGRPVLVVDSDDALIGKPLDLHAHDAARASMRATLLLAGFSKTSWGALPLPLNLAFLQLPSCNVHVAGDDVLGTLSLSTKDAKWTLPLPNDARLRAIPLYFQVVARGFEMSQALEVRVR
ncbi:MAG: DNRLRE domain-containing protein [Planctomycetes bacterium]|nr:DNRLRE domain-containing protein [Planctomycetota bacterium]MCB9917765.1 DNRLRE domain-containing protein [Planctomycetota bacterium]